MILSALEALKGTKPTSRQAISKHISKNHPILPPSHSSLLSLHLRRLLSKGLIRIFKNSYKLAENAPESKKRGRPPKNVGVYVLPQAEQMESGFLRSLPGAVAIVLPEGILSKKTAKSPVLILPNGVQSLVDVSGGKRKKEELVEKRGVGAMRRKAVVPKKVVVRDGENVDLGRKKLGRPRKVRENGDLREEGENVGGRRKLGRPRKVRENGDLEGFGLSGVEEGMLEV